MTLPTLTTSRLILRALRDTDAQYVAELAGEWAVAGNTGRIPFPYTEIMAAEFIAYQSQAAKDGREWVFAVCRQDDASLLGCVGVSMEGDVAELGYWFGQQHWGQGYATEAGRAVVDFAFVHARPTRIMSDHLPANVASGQVLDKLGFEFCGLRTVNWRDGQAIDLLQYQLNCTDWAKTQTHEDLYDSVSASQ
ncbi:GNAT family N-acetyltransferase [Chitinibacter bivalviorum]|uniref:GNAT family N-acetyltransferase n=1 Tax=Chitinibacter bivalviorum TaxID=2739434 RepID=A0A7H9BQ07_9NEIS|nr:GNAT family N-acetyltransferase [Chitinibacter bivalviorum]QLG89424.1 GNAT family N-acetyltransferase [Chitinibacter bivalviorum]